MRRNSLTNLLPPERIALLRRDYFVRLGVVVLAVAIALVAIAGVLLIPTYSYLSVTAQTKQARLAQIRSSLASADQASLSARLTALSSDAKTLLALKNTPSATNLIQEALAVARPGITLIGFTYAPADGSSAGTLSLSGTASTRDALRQYQLALSAAPFVTTADLPVSAYAQDTNIGFTITLTLKP